MNDLAQPKLSAELTGQRRDSLDETGDNSVALWTWATATLSVIC